MYCRHQALLKRQQFFLQLNFAKTFLKYQKKYIPLDMHFRDKGVILSENLGRKEGDLTF